MKHFVEKTWAENDIELKVDIFDSTAITFSKDGQFTTEYSTLGAMLISKAEIIIDFIDGVHQNVIGIKSKKTGKIAYYKIQSTKWNDEGEKEYDVWVPTFTTAQIMPQLKHTTLKIFND